MRHLDLEPLELALRSSMHQIGGVLLEKLLNSDEEALALHGSNVARAIGRNLWNTDARNPYRAFQSYRTTGLLFTARFVPVESPPRIKSWTLWGLVFNEFRLARCFGFALGLGWRTKPRHCSCRGHLLRLPSRSQCPGLALAGFEVTLIGRICVTPGADSCAEPKNQLPSTADSIQCYLSTKVQKFKSFTENPPHAWPVRKQRNELMSLSSRCFLGRRLI